MQAANVDQGNQGEWTEVKRKQRPSPSESDKDEASPTPLNTFKGLRNVDEVEKKAGAKGISSTGNASDSTKLSKSQRKKIRKNNLGGVQSPKATL